MEPNATTPSGEARGQQTRRWRRRLAVALAATSVLTPLTVGSAGANFPPIEPVAIFTATPSVGTAPLTVAFDGRASTGPNPLVTWDWTFGDGSTGIGDQTTHVYDTPGTYQASLVVTDNLTLHSLPRIMSIEVTAPLPPAAPTTLSARPASRTSISLTWTNASANQTSVKIERCKGSRCTTFAEVATAAGVDTAFTDTGLVPGRVYRYRVRASNAGGDSGYSNIARSHTLR
jgi:PKD repeat protein